jgi:hypothetical protein
VPSGKILSFDWTSVSEDELSGNDHFCRACDAESTLIQEEERDEKNG